MRINYFGLSCFLIENETGHRIIVDPFSDEPEWSLGPRFPAKFNGKPFGTNIVLMSEPDADHSCAPGGWLQTAPETKPNSDPFPGLDLKGTIIYEWNGDLNIAWHYTIDGLRLAHFGDNAHLLTDAQLAELGRPDIVFMSPPKVASDAGIQMTKDNLKALAPKLIIWAHHVAPEGMPDVTDVEARNAFLEKYFSERASSNKNYKGEGSFRALYDMIDAALEINKEYESEIRDDTVLEITDDMLRSAAEKPKTILFTRMVAD